MAIISKLVYKGLKANLPTTRSADSFYLCTDTRELYFGAELYTESVRFYNGQQARYSRSRCAVHRRGHWQG